MWAILKGVVGLATHHPLAYTTPSYSSALALSLRHFCVNVCQVGCHRGHHHPPHHTPHTPPLSLHFSLKWSLVAQQSVWCCCCGCCCLLLLLLSGAQRGVHMVYIRLSSTPMHTLTHTDTHTDTQYHKNTHGRITPLAPTCNGLGTVEKYLFYDYSLTIL